MNRDGTSRRQAPEIVPTLNAFIRSTLQKGEVRLLQTTASATCTTVACVMGRVCCVLVFVLSTACMTCPQLACMVLDFTFRLSDAVCLPVSVLVACRVEVIRMAWMR